MNNNNNKTSNWCVYVFIWFFVCLFFPRKVILTNKNSNIGGMKFIY